jgi:hypothetical protein
VVGIIESISATIADEIAIDRFAKMAFQPNYFPITGAGNGVTSEGTMDAKRGSALKVPSSSFETRRFICINTCRAEVDEISRERTLQRTVFVPSEIGTVTDLHGTEVPVTRKFLIESPASPAMDTAVHFMLDKDAEVLITIGPFLSQVAPDPMAAGNGHILKETVPAFVADRAIMGMVHHQPLDHMLAKIDSLLMNR